MEKKERHDIQLANFNCVFGRNEPMLEYFDKILYPAFTSGEIRKKNKDTSFFFLNVRIVEYKNDFILTGNFVKETKLEVKSHYIPGKGLIPTYEIHPTSPYSIFAIFLKNHRMLFYRNQKGSPLLSAFKGTADFLLKNFLLKENKDRSLKDALPGATLSIIPIPSTKELITQLQSLKKVNSLTLNLFPVNNDIGICKTFDNLRAEIENIGSSTAKVTITSPENITETSKFINNTQGTIEAVIRGKNAKGGNMVLHHDSFTETIPVQINSDNSYLDTTIEVIKSGYDHPSIQLTSEENQSIYFDKVDIIRSKME